MKSFPLANKDLGECKADFRVEKRDIPLLIDALSTSCVQMPQWNNLRWSRRPVYNAEEICLPVPVFRHDTYFWTIRARTEHD